MIETKMRIKHLGINLKITIKGIVEKLRMLIKCRKCKEILKAC